MANGGVQAPMVPEILAFHPNQPKRTVLVVDDDVLVRLTVAEYLRETGFRVLEASGLVEAKAVIDSEPAIDIVFSDVQMPGPDDGFILARWARERRPGIHVLLTSGAARSARIAEDVGDDGPVIAKPYDHASLAEMLSALPDRSAD